MKVQSVQKVIRLGSYGAVRVPLADMLSLGVSFGMPLRVTFEPAHDIDPERIKLVGITQKLITRHKLALKKLAKQ